MELTFQSQWQRQPTVEEFNGMVENKIQEEILYREGLQMGLDKDDTIVKRRMAQKVQFLAEDVAAAHEPSTQELKAWFAGNAEKFALPGRVTFRHVFFGFDKRGPNAQKDAAAALPRLAGQPQNSPLAAATADAFMFEDYYADRTAEQLAKEFGPTFAVGIFGLKPGAWSGPLESGYGWHLVFIDSIIPGRIPEFEEVEPDVQHRVAGRAKAAGLAGGVRAHACEVHGAAARSPSRRERSPGRAAAQRAAAAGGFAPVIARSAGVSGPGARCGCCSQRCASVPLRRTRRDPVTWRSPKTRPCSTRSCGAPRCSPACACRSHCGCPPGSKTSGTPRCRNSATHSSSVAGFPQVRRAWRGSASSSSGCRRPSPTCWCA